jgi:hypothetical protein
MTDLIGFTPESWRCIDCGVNTAPGFLSRADKERAFAADALRVEEGVTQHITEWSEVYTVRDAVWKAAGMEPYGGCLRIGCLEKRLGRKLTPKDFPRRHPFNNPKVPGTPRLRERRGGYRPPRDASSTLRSCKPFRCRPTGYACP